MLQKSQGTQVKISHSGQAKEATQALMSHVVLSKGGGGLGI